jgi:ATP-dependent DNA helicase RecG
VAGRLLDEPLVKLLGKDAKAFATQLGLHTAGDLLRHYPRRYLNPSEPTRLAELPVGEVATLIADVVKAGTRPMRQRRGKILEVVVSDGQDTLDLTFFKPYGHEERLVPGFRGLFTGTVSLYRGRRQLAHPQYKPVMDAFDEIVARDRMTAPLPVYPASARLDSWKIEKAVELVLATLDLSEELDDPVPVEVRARMGLMGLGEAFRAIHRPDTPDDWRSAQRRLRFDEAFVLQAALARRRSELAALPATPRPGQDGGLLAAFDQRLPFALTQGQQAVSEDLDVDLARSHPMHRLLQGEVGSGKTVVALRAMLRVVDAGGQAALLAPTEVLAAQHYASITRMLGDLAARGMLGGDDRGTQVALLTGSMPTAGRRAAMLAAASGDAGIVIGTHALLQDKVEFFDLGLVVVDEQHRFGVEQRDALRGKGRVTPHLLVMTATPIPRTVAMTVFGDLDVSTLRELPAGRQPIVSHVVPVGEKPGWISRVWGRVAEEAAAGHQVYVVCSRIGDEAEPDQPAPDPDDPDQDGPGPADDASAPRKTRSVVDVLAELREREELSGLQVAMLHGRMPTDERDAVMRRFARGEVDVLVATTVVEVGVDVPNASAMVVLDADRFGVSQLHQLRGRVGRGSTGGICLLVTESEAGTPARERLDAVAGTVDGFELARVDLEQRREGDVLGAAQSGSRSSLRLLRVLRDEKLIETARNEALTVVAGDPDLSGHPALDAAIRDLLDPAAEAYLDRT